MSKDKRSVNSNGIGQAYKTREIQRYRGMTRLAGCIWWWKMEIYHLSEMKASSHVVPLFITSCDFFQQLNWLKYLLQIFCNSKPAVWSFHQCNAATKSDLISPDVEHLSFLIKGTGVSAVEKHVLLKVTCSEMENWNFALSSSSWCERKARKLSPFEVEFILFKWCA